MFALQTFFMAPVATRHTASQPIQGRGRRSTAPCLRKSALPMQAKPEKEGEKEGRGVCEEPFFICGCCRYEHSFRDAGGHLLVLAAHIEVP